MTKILILVLSAFILSIPAGITTTMTLTLRSEESVDWRGLFSEEWLVWFSWLVWLSIVSSMERTTRKTHKEKRKKAVLCTLRWFMRNTDTKRMRNPLHLYEYISGYRINCFVLLRLDNICFFLFLLIKLFLLL
jgi:hypothetical protein